MDENSIDLRELFYIIVENFRRIAKITGIFIAVAILYLLIASPVYESESLLRIKQPRGIGDSILETVSGSNSMANKQLMSTYAEILKSRSVVVPVIAATEKPNKEGKFPAYEGYIKGRITTVPFKDTEILKLTVNAETPEQAQKANLLLVQGFLHRLTGLTRAEQKATREFLDGRVNESRQELDKTELALQEYKKKHKIISPTDTIKALTERFLLVDKNKAENQIALATAQAKLAAVNGQLGGEAQSSADNATVQQYRAKLAELEITRAGYLEKYTEKHPKMIEINDAIAQVRSQMQAEAAKVAALEAPSDNPVHQGLLAAKYQSQAEIASAQARAEALAAVDKTNEEALAKLPQVEQGYVRVQRDANVAQEIYIMLAKRLEEAKVAEASVSTEVQVVDTATLPEAPVKPRQALTLVLAAILGFLVGCGTSIAIELLTRMVRTEEDITNYLGLPVLGVIPDLDSLKDAENRKKRYGDKTGKMHTLLEKIRRHLWN